MGLTSSWSPLLLAFTSLCAIVALAALWYRHFNLARVAAIGQVIAILLGWGLAQYPYLIVPDLTIHESAGPAATLELNAPTSRVAARTAESWTVESSTI